RPAFLPIGAIDAEELARRAQRVDAAGVDRRRGARPVAEDIAEVGLVGVRPILIARVAVVADQRLLAAALLPRDGPLARPGRAGEAAAARLAPEDLRRGRFPVGREQLWRRDDAVAARPAEAREVGDGVDGEIDPFDGRRRQFALGDLARAVEQLLGAGLPAEA